MPSSRAQQQYRRRRASQQAEQSSQSLFSGKVISTGVNGNHVLVQIQGGQLECEITGPVGLCQAVSVIKPTNGLYGLVVTKSRS